MSERSDSETVVRSAFAALVRSDVEAVLPHVDQHVEWTFLDPSVEDPTPRTCVGRAEFGYWIRRFADQGFPSELEEVVASGDRVAVVTRTKGFDTRRARKAEDRNFHVVTVRDNKITALTAYKSRDEAVTALEETSSEARFAFRIGPLRGLHRHCRNYVPGRSWLA